MTSLDIPSTVTFIGEEAFYGCTLQPLVLRGVVNSTDRVKGLGRNSYILTEASQVSRIRSQYTFTYALAEPYCAIVKPYLRGLEVSLVKNPYSDIKTSLVGVYIDDFEGPMITPDEDGIYRKFGLEMSSSHMVGIKYLLDGGEEEWFIQEYKTNGLDINTYRVETTQTTATVPGMLWVRAMVYTPYESYDALDVQETGIIFNDTKYQTGDVITGLKPGTRYEFSAYVVDEDGVLYTKSGAFSTEKVTVSIDNPQVSPTTFTYTKNCVIGDAHVKKAWLSVNGADAGDVEVLTGLEPKTSYQATLSVETEEGTSHTASYKFTTPALTITTLTPKVTRKGEAVVAADTNLSDEETSVGFEWRKTDAPATVQSKQGTAVVYNGTMEGLIKNMASGTYYDVRPFYKSAEGKLYYGEWIGIDPDDFSFFEPTVHTYASAVVTEGLVTLTGYVMTGSEDILEQGFEYWLKDGAQAKGLGQTTATGIQTVVGTGQHMTASLDGLQSGAAYVYRAYVKTASGTTYGEKQEFTAPVVSGIGTVSAELPVRQGRRVQGIYTLTGTKVADDAAVLRQLPRGIYIVNGRKTVVR